MGLLIVSMTFCCIMIQINRNQGCTHGSVRLVNGGTINEGRVEICMDNNWGLVCEDGWDAPDAQVVCRQLGLPTESAEAYVRSHFGAGTAPFLISDVSCTGSENSLTDCDYGTHYFCEKYEDAGVKCPTMSTTASSIFLNFHTTSMISQSSVSQLGTQINSISSISLSDVSVPKATPDIVMNNAIKVTFTSFTIISFTEQNELIFKAATANSCNTFCSSSNFELCSGVLLSFSKRQWIPLLSDNVKILSKADTSNGLEIVMYVALSTVSVLSIDALNKAIQNGISSGEFNLAGFKSFIAEPFIESDEGVSVVSIEIISGVGIVLIIVVILLIVGIILTIMQKIYNKRKSITSENQNHQVVTEPVSGGIDSAEDNYY